MYKRILLIVFSAFLSLYTYAQIDSTFLDTKYLEDQLYLSLTYNTLVNKADDFNTNGLSGGISLGLIKDLPINKKRTLGFGIGLGYSYNIFNQNLKISKSLDNTLFEIIDNDSFDKNRLILHSIDLPIEFRWRTSTPTKYKFWRIYAGINFEYIFANNSKFSDNIETINIKNISEIKKIRYGAMLSAGYDTWNIRLYYGLTPIFESNTSIDLQQLNLGLMFYFF